MKLTKILALSTLIGLQFTIASAAHAANTSEKFEFNYNPALISTQAGRVEIKQNLTIEARNFCKNGMSLRHAVRHERACTRALISEANAQIADRHPIWNENITPVAERPNRIRRAYKALTPGLR
ncbi:UrcA family protein [Henriciella sp. AS95]|uniref:UrcA family protein n=1 Tax=Henriciella sp. AS95 TaxID=3135782 RepID=UPI0031705666